MNKNIDKGDDEDCGCKENGQTEGMGRPMTVLALLNGMIGGASMVLPQIGLKTGWLLTIGVCVFVGFISYYTSYLIVLHLGKCRNIRQCILSHFKQDHRYLTGYGLVLFLSITPTLIIYFKIICLQLEGLMGYHSDWLAPSLAAFMIVVVIIIRIMRVGEETLAYGVISIVAYLIFLLWAQISAPSGPKTVPVAVDPISLTAAMITAFSCHDLLVQNIIKHTKQENYLGIVRWTYVFAVMIFSFITLGSFAIVNRQSGNPHPEIITDYFRPGEWQNKVIEGIYVIHILTAFPNFLLVSKLRFYQIFGIQTKCNISWHEVLYIVLGIVICCVVYQLKVEVEVLVTIKGAFFGYVYIIIIPVWIHFRCIFTNKSNGFIEGNQQYNSQVSCDGCECENVYRSKWTLILETGFLVFVVLFGFALMVFTLFKLINK